MRTPPDGCAHSAERGADFPSEWCIAAGTNGAAAMQDSNAYSAIAVFSYGVAFNFYHVRIDDNPVADDVDHGGIVKRSMLLITSNWERKMVDETLFLASISSSRSLTSLFSESRAAIHPGSVD